MTAKEEHFRKMYKLRNGSTKNATKAWKRRQRKQIGGKK